MIVRRAKFNELENLRNFYNSYWGGRHALINVKNFIDFYFTDGEHLNFIIAHETRGSEIISACGYIVSNSTDTPDVWTTLWLTKKGAEGSIGLRIVDYITNQMGFRIVSTNNARPSTLVLYEFLGYETAKMNHYYRLSERKNYKIAILKDNCILPFEKTNYTLKQFKTPDELIHEFNPAASLSNRPYKDLAYIIRRFYSFPFYNYLLFGIMDEEKHCHSIIVLRKVDLMGVSILRIVDLIGRYEDLSKIGYCIQNLLCTLDCEYIDLYCYGITQEILTKAGFSKRDENSLNIIPDYLEPYAPVNTEYYFFCNKINDFKLFRADGDLDRLNINLI